MTDETDSWLSRLYELSVRAARLIGRVLITGGAALGLFDMLTGIYLMLIGIGLLLSFRESDVR